VQNPKVRGAAFCEIIPLVGRAPDLVAQFYSTGGPDDYCLSDKMGSARPDQTGSGTGRCICVFARQPLYQILTPDQKRRMGHLAMVTLREMRTAGEHRRLQSEEDDE
jgi:hypothetical protein